MVLGMVGPAFAAGSTPPDDPKKAAESELIEENGKLKAKLSLPKTEKRPVRFMAMAMAKSGAEPGFGETKVTVNIAKHGIGSNEFAFDKVFGAGAAKKITLYNDADGSSQEKTFTKDDASITFDTPVSMDAVKAGDVFIEFEGTHVAGKLTWEESDPSYSGGTNVTTYKLDIYQVRNTDVIVKTVDKDGVEKANPTTAATSGKIKLGSLNEEIDIPVKGTTGVFVKGTIRVKDVDTLNGNPNYSIEGLKDGLLVDKANNKVYKPGEFVVDPEGIKSTEIKFTEKPLVTEDPKYANDDDYVDVTFDQGKNGTIATNKSYYVFKGIEMASKLTPPDVTADSGWEFTGWKPDLAKKYDKATKHVAQYTQKTTTEEVIPYLPDETEPTEDKDGKKIPDNYVTVTFKAEKDGETALGTVTVGTKTGEVVKAKVKPGTNLEGRATATAKDGYGFTKWDPALTTINKESAKEFTAKFIKDGSEVGKDDPIPTGWNKVTVKQDATSIKENTVEEKTYAVAPKDDAKGQTGKLAADKFPSLKDKEAQGYENPGWYKDTDKKATEKPWDVEITAGTTFTAKATANGQPSKPTIENPAAKNEKGKDSTTVTGKTKPNTKVTVTDEKGNKIGEGTSDPDGNFTIQTNPKQEKGKKVTLTPEGGDGIKVTVTEDETPDDKPSAPSITWRGLWFLGGNSEPAKTSKEMETGRHYKYLYGYVDKTVRPEGMITRSEAAALIARLANLDMTDKTKPNFKDTPSAWYNSAINAMVSRNLMFADKNGNFRPNEPITRGEFARALYYIDKKNDKVAPFADVKGHEFEEAINQAYGNDRIAGYPDGTFKPDAKIQRAEAARILNQYADRNVTLVGMANVKRDLVRFTDINESHWAYCEVMEAANSHEYQREKGTLAETWLKILDK